jgi:phosphosulfolactate synthase
MATSAEEHQPMDFLDLPQRAAKPRDKGLTHVLDKGLGPAQVADLLAVAASHIDIVKLGWGSAYVTDGLSQKIAVYRRGGIPVCFGGTMLEVALRQNRLDGYLEAARRYGVAHVEVSDGTLDLPAEDKLALVRRLSRDFVVLSEVGSKDSAKVRAPYLWVESIKRELDAGAWKVIAEGGESGTAGIYFNDGQVKEGLVDEILSAVNVDDLLFETPANPQQVWFIKRFGPNVNLGNIPPDEVIPVETLRLGLRGDTLLHFR